MELSHASAGRIRGHDLFRRRVAGSEIVCDIVFVSVVIPALNEEEPIADVVRECLATGLPNEVIVADNGSTDRTAENARAAGARVVAEPKRGYGRACMAGVGAISAGCDIIVFLDGDGSDCPEFMNQLVDPIACGRHDFVIGSRTRGQREAGQHEFPTGFLRTNGRLDFATPLRCVLH